MCITIQLFQATGVNKDFNPLQLVYMCFGTVLSSITIASS